MAGTERDAVLSNWLATFADLRQAGITLAEWLAYHRGRIRPITR